MHACKYEKLRWFYIYFGVKTLLFLCCCKTCSTMCACCNAFLFFEPALGHLHNLQRILLANCLHQFYLRLHAQALTLAALAGAAVVEYYDHKTGAKERNSGQ